MDDLDAVLDAVGSRRTALIGAVEAGLCAMHAADVVCQEPMIAGATQDCENPASGFDADRLASTFGLDDTRTNPLSVTGHVDHPSLLFLLNHARGAA